MAQGAGSAKTILGLLQTFGGLFWNAIDFTGSSSYVQGGDTISPRSFGFNDHIWDISTSLDHTGQWSTEPRPLNSGFTQWQIVWISLTTATIGGQAQTAGQEAVAGTNLSAFTVRLGAHGQ